MPIWGTAHRQQHRQVEVKDRPAAAFTLLTSQFDPTNFLKALDVVNQEMMFVFCFFSLHVHTLRRAHTRRPSPSRLAGDIDL